MNRLRLFAIRLLNYLTNHVVANVPSYGLRHAWYRWLGVDLGSGSSIQLGCYLWFFGPNALRRSGVRIGRNTRINRRCCLDGRGPLHIGDNVSISPEVSVITTGHDWREAGFPLESRGVTIEDHVWIGVRATILPGAHIGRGSVVAAGAVVSGCVPPHTVVAGTPARPVASRPESALAYVLDAPAPLFE